MINPLHPGQSPFFCPAGVSQGVRALLLFAVTLVVSDVAQADQFSVKAIDELVCAYPDQLPNGVAELTHLDVPRGSLGAVHLVVHGHDPSLPLTIEGRRSSGEAVEYFHLRAVPVEENTGLSGRTTQWDPDPNPHIIRAAPFDVYEVLRPVSGKSIQPDSGGVNEVIRVEFPISSDAEPGIDLLELRVGQAGGYQSIRLPVHVHAAVVAPPGRDTLCFTNWFGPARMTRWYGIDPWSDAHWALLEQYAALMKRTRQNVIEVPLQSFLTRSADSDRWDLDTRRFDRYVELFSSGGGWWLEGRHLASRPKADWSSPDLQLNFGDRPIASTPEGQQLVGALMNPLNAHLQQRGWSGRWLQHVADEPTSTNASAYNALATQVRAGLPGVRIMDASMCTDLVGGIDIWCPQTRAYQEHQAFFDQRVAEGDEVWVYSCLVPGGPWLNRLLDQERLRPVLIGWAASRDGVTGYLHWGYNKWYADPYGQSVVDHPQAPGTTNKLPAGDTHVVYPREDGLPGVLSGMRLEAHRIGLEDHALLELVRARDPQAADALIARLFTGYDDYQTDPGLYRSVRRDLVEAAGKKTPRVD